MLHIKSQMGFLEPVIELMISEGKPGDAGRRAIVVIAPEFPSDVASGSTPSILASPPKGDTATARLPPGQLATARESTLTPSNTSTSSAYGMNVSEATPSDHGMKASEGKIKDHGMEASSSATVPAFGMQASEKTVTN